jgi:hypothetical protein
MKLKEFLVDFKDQEILNVEDLRLDKDIEIEYVRLLNEFFSREVEDRDIILDDLDNQNGFLYNLMCEWFEDEFIVENDLGLVWYEYSLEDLFRDSFDADGDMYKLFTIEEIDSKLYNGIDEEE